MGRKRAMPMAGRHAPCPLLRCAIPEPHTVTIAFVHMYKVTRYRDQSTLSCRASTSGTVTRTRTRPVVCVLPRLYSLLRNVLLTPKCAAQGPPRHRAQLPPTAMPRSTECASCAPCTHELVRFSWPCSFVLALGIVRCPEGEVVAEELHDGGRVLVRLLVQRVDLGDGVVECLLGELACHLRLVLHLQTVGEACVWASGGASGGANGGARGGSVERVEARSAEVRATGVGDGGWADGGVGRWGGGGEGAPRRRWGEGTGKARGGRNAGESGATDEASAKRGEWSGRGGAKGERGGGCAAWCADASVCLYTVSTHH